MRAGTIRRGTIHWAGLFAPITQNIERTKDRVAVRGGSPHQALEEDYLEISQEIAEDEGRDQSCLKGL